MTEERFDELINLYLDNEIGRSDLSEIKHEMQQNLVRRRKFERACELHQAARKVLTSPATGERQTGGAPSSRPASGGSRPSSWRKPGSGSAKDSMKSKQAQAYRNASVGALAERQEKEGAASQVELGKIKLESRSGKKTGGGAASAHSFSFFDSPLGMAMGIFLTLVGALGMYLILKATSPTGDDDPGKLITQSPITQLDGGYDPKAAEELAAEVKKRKAATAAADALRARVYQSALTGQSSANPAPVDYFSSHLDPASAGNTAGNVSSSVPQSTDSMTPTAPAKPDGTSAAPATQP